MSWFLLQNIPQPFSPPPPHLSGHDLHRLVVWIAAITSQHCSLLFSGPFPTKPTEWPSCQQVMSLSAQSLRSTARYDGLQGKGWWGRLTSWPLWLLHVPTVAVPLCPSVWHWSPLAVLCQGTGRTCRELRMVWAWSFKVLPSSVVSLCPSQVETNARSKEVALQTNPQSM